MATGAAGFPGCKSTSTVSTAKQRTSAQSSSRLSAHRQQKSRQEALSADSHTSGVFALADKVVDAVKQRNQEVRSNGRMRRKNEVKRLHRVRKGTSTRHSNP